MDAFDWFHLLTPLALIAGVANFLAGLALKPEHRTDRCKKYSTIAYCGLGIGWLIMKIALTFKSMVLLTNIAIIGWLLLIPSLLLVIGCFLFRLKQDKQNFSLLAHKIINIIFLFIRGFLLTIKCIYKNALVFLLNTRTKKHEEIQEKSPYMFGGPVFGEPPQDMFGGVQPSNDKKSSPF